MIKLTLITIIVITIISSTLIPTVADEGIESSNPTIQAIYDAYNDRNAEILEDLATSDFVLWQNDEVVQEGSDGLANWVLGNYTFFPDGHIPILREVVEGDFNLTHWSFTGTHAVGLPPPADGEIYFSGTILARMEGEKVAEMWVYWDNLPMAIELGMVSDSSALPVETEYLFDLIITLDAESSNSSGGGPYGSRESILISGGRIEGPEINGEILYGSDYGISRADDVFELRVQLLIRTDDDQIIYMSYNGIIHTTPEGETYWRILPNFETGAEKYAWLNRTFTVGTFENLDDQLVYKVYAIK